MRFLRLNFTASVFAQWNLEPLNTLLKICIFTAAIVLVHYEEYGAPQVPANKHGSVTAPQESPPVTVPLADRISRLLTCGHCVSELTMGKSCRRNT